MHKLIHCILDFETLSSKTVFLAVHLHRQVSYVWNYCIFTVTSHSLHDVWGPFSVQGNILDLPVVGMIRSKSRWGQRYKWPEQLDGTLNICTFYQFEVFCIHNRKPINLSIQAHKRHCQSLQTLSSQAKALEVVSEKGWCWVWPGKRCDVGRIPRVRQRGMEGHICCLGLRLLYTNMLKWNG